jgi:hypothetical protein
VEVHQYVVQLKMVLTFLTSSNKTNVERWLQKLSSKNQLNEEKKFYKPKPKAL